MPLDGIVRQPKTQIDVYSDGRKPEKRFKEIFLLSAEGGTNDEAGKYKEFIERAKKVGADGVILSTKEAGSSYGPFGGGTRFFFKGTAVVYESQQRQ